MVRQMIKADAEDVAEIHRETLAGDFLPRLGKSFLTTLYKCVFSINVGFGIVYEENTRVIGVAVATEDTDSFLKRLFLKQFWLLIPRTISPLLKQPSLIRHVLETLFYSNGKNDKAHPRAELITLCIRKAYQRQGIGKELLFALSDEFKRRGVKSFTVRVYDDNKAANKFYIKAGFEWSYSYMMYGRKWSLYNYSVR